MIQLSAALNNLSYIRVRVSGQPRVALSLRLALLVLTQVATDSECHGLLRVTVTRCTA